MTTPIVNNLFKQDKPGPVSSFAVKLDTLHLKLEDGDRPVFKWRTHLLSVLAHTFEDTPS